MTEQEREQLVYNYLKNNCFTDSHRNIYPILSVIERTKAGNYIEHRYNWKKPHIKGWPDSMLKPFSITKVMVRYESNKRTKIKNMYYCDYGCSKGWHYFWYDSKSNYKKDWDIWYTCSPYLEEKIYSAKVINPEIIADDESLKYCFWNQDVDFINYIKVYRKHPEAEMLMKLKFYRMVFDENTYKYLSDNHFKKWLFAHKDEITSTTSFTYCKNAYKRNVSVESYTGSLIDRICIGRQLSNMNKNAYKLALKYIDQEHLNSYLKEQKVDPASYGDYIQAVEYLKLDLSDTKVLKPKNFWEMHHLYIPQYEEHKREIEHKANEKKYRSISEKMKETAKKIMFVEQQSKDFTTILAKSKADLIDEGEALHHCVGRMYYDEKQASGTTAIVFLRKTNDINKPFVTIELDLKSFEVLQCYAEHDSKPDEQVMNYVNLWKDNIKLLRKVKKEKLYGSKN